MAKQKHSFSVKLLRLNRSYHRNQVTVLKRHLKRKWDNIPKVILRTTAKNLQWHQRILNDIDTAIVKLKK